MTGKYSLQKYIQGFDDLITIDQLYSKYSNNPIVLYAISELYPDDKLKDGTQIQLLTEKQLEYIERLINKQPAERITDIQAALGINHALITVWNRANRLYSKIMDIIKEMQAEQAETILWHNATDDENKDNISRMFALKARKQEYKDNAQPTNNSIISVRVTLDNKDFDTSASIKAIETDFE